MSTSGRISKLIHRLKCLLRRKRTCDVRFSLQGRYASVLDLSDFGIANTVVSIHGSALHAGHGINEDDFISKYSNAELSAHLNSYLDRNIPNPDSNDLIILDMEPSYPDPDDDTGRKQKQFSPSDLGDYDDTTRDQLIGAYARRIKVARDVLRDRWPNHKLKLGLYGVVVPMGRGQENEAFQKRMRAYRRGSELGMYDDLDDLVPVLYQGFGPSDVHLPDEKAKLHDWIEKATRQAINNSQQLTRRDGSRVPLAPILTFWVNNGNSAHHKKVILPETLGFQLRIVREYCSVETIVLWSGSETIEEMRQTEFEPFDIREFLSRVHKLPFPGCK